MLSVRNLSVSFARYDRGLRQRDLVAISDLDLSVAAGEVVAVVGASGAGKSLLAHAVLGVLPANATVGGEIAFKGAPLTPARAEALRGREIALVPQSVAYLNPLLRVGRQVRRAAELAGRPRREAAAAAAAQFGAYRLAADVGRRYPFEVSGGMARRVLMATATAGRADLLIADEPTNGLDGPVARESVRMLRAWADAGKAVVLITHDIETALEVADRVAVFRDGRTVETAPAAAFAGAGERLAEPYSRALWRALPQNDFAGAEAPREAPRVAPSAAPSAAPADEGLRADAVSFAYGRGARVLDGAALHVHPGETVGLAGPSGGGKTTLARLLAGYLTPQAGRVTLGGQPLPRAGYAPVQMVFQHPRLAMNPQWPLRRVVDEGVVPPAHLLEALQIRPEWLDRFPHELSGGELQRLAVARVLNSQTRFLVADEMTSMLDALTQAQIWRAVRSEADRLGIGLLVVSHDAALLGRLCSRVVRMSDVATPSALAFA